MDDVRKIPESFAYCETIRDPIRNRLVWDGLISSYSRINRLSPDEAPGVVLDAMVLVKLLEAVTADPELLVALATGAPTPVQSESLDQLLERAEARHFIVRGEEAAAHAAGIERPEVRNLVSHGLAASLRWLFEALNEDRPEAPVDLLLHAQMLQEMFRLPEGIAYVAAGKPVMPWIEFDE
jgi:hypothetical protein